MTMPAPSSAAARQRQWHALGLLCGLGLGLAPIAPEVCAVLRTLVGADAAALFWLGEDGRPEGFFHEDSPASAQDLFLNEFGRLFSGPGEINVHTLARADGPRTGRLLLPDTHHFFRSNSYNLLVRASGHRHTLDLRVEVQGRTRAIAMLFRAPGPGFSAGDAALLERASGWLARAFAAPPAPQPAQAEGTGPVGHVVLDAEGRLALFADEAAAQLLRQANLPGLGLRATGPSHPVALPPGLPGRLGVAGPGAAARIAVPGGWLAADLRALQPLGDGRGGPGGAGQHLLTLQLERPHSVVVAQRVLALPLSPLQREIALLAGLGHARADSHRLAGVGEAALKKHLRAIFAATGASDWDDLGRRLQG
jgi:DNA-binding CsgD family transcriptional regulator